MTNSIPFELFAHLCSSTCLVNSGEVVWSKQSAINRGDFPKRKVQETLFPPQFSLFQLAIEHPCRWQDEQERRAIYHVPALGILEIETSSGFRSVLTVSLVQDQGSRRGRIPKRLTRTMTRRHVVLPCEYRIAFHDPSYIFASLCLPSLSTYVRSSNRSQSDRR